MKEWKRDGTKEVQSSGSSKTIRSITHHSLCHKLERRYKYLKGRRREVDIGAKQVTHQGVASVRLCAKSSHSEFGWSKRMWSNTSKYVRHGSQRLVFPDRTVERYIDTSHKRITNTTSPVPQQIPRFTSIYLRLQISAALIHSANTLIAHPPSQTHPEWTEPRDRASRPRWQIHPLR